MNAALRITVRGVLFSGQAGKSRNDYYFVFNNKHGSGDIKVTLNKLVKAAKTKNVLAYANYSIYVYEKTDNINETFTGNMDDIRGVYDDALISYARWTKGKLDVFYYIESGSVVYDIFERRVVSPRWEFD